MSSYVALLRGINVGGHNRVPMAELRAGLAGLGYSDVRTHLQSGNVVFRAPMAADDEFAGNPLETTEPARLLVLFLSAVPEPARLAGIDPARYLPERFALRPTEIYLYCAVGIIESPLLKVFTDKRLGCAVTARNWNTVTRVAELLDR